MKVCIVLPTYNERENVKALLPLLLRTKIPGELHVLVVDDSSPDGTAAEVISLQKTFSRLHLLNRDKKEGLGAAYIAGISHALTTFNPDVIIEMDADFSHAPEDVPRLLAALTDAELAIGSRYIRGGTIKGWNVWRKLISKGGNALSRFLVGLPVTDCTAGFRAWDSRLLKRIDLTRLGVSGYAFQLSILYQAVSLGARVREIPVTFHERREGASKLGWKDVGEFFFTSLRLAMR